MSNRILIRRTRTAPADTNSHHEPEHSVPDTREYRPNGHSPVSPLPSVYEPVTRQSIESGPFRAARLRWTAHWTERATQAEHRLLQSRLRLTEERTQLAEVEMEARRRLAQVARFAEDEEAERLLRQRLRDAAPDEARRLLEREVETTTLLLERELLRHQLQAIPSGGDPATLRLPSAKTNGTLEVHVSDEQIETLALQAVARLSQMEPPEAEQAWSDWRRELLRRMPAYAAAEAIRRAEELRNLVR